jgi:hypothetical protein
VNSVPLWLMIVAEKSTLAVYGKLTTESQSAREDGRRPRAGFVSFVSFVVYIVANRFDRIGDNGF